MPPRVKIAKSDVRIVADPQRAAIAFGRRRVNMWMSRRLRSALLTAHGWKYQRVYSMQLFSDPSQVAFDLAESLGVQVFQRSRPGYQDEVAFEDTDHAWGDKPAMDNDQRLKNDKPPHWQ